jgi:hypothetical protein
LLDTQISLPIVVKTLSEPSVSVTPSQPAPERDEGAFWSDGDDDNEDDAPLNIQLPDDDDDDLVLKPNPLVTGRARAVDLTASIRSHAEVLRRELTPAPIDEPPTPPALDPPSPATPVEAPTLSAVADDYGELAEEPEPRAAKPERRAAKGRSRFRTREEQPSEE